MRILYGVVGEGMGHAIRSRVVLDELSRRHQVEVVVSGRAHDYLKAIESDRLGVNHIWGLTLVYEDNRVRNFRTVLANLKGALVSGGWPENIRAFFDLAERFRPDVVVSDFESWSYLFARMNGIPVISIDNQQIVARCDLPPEVTAGHEAEAQLTRGIVKAKLPGCLHYLVTTFFYPPVVKQRTTLVPPILRPEVLSARPDTGEHLLVYQTSTSDAALLERLRATGVECRIYGVRRGIQEEERDGSLRFRPFSDVGFIDDLRTARGVVANGGFTLLGEAVYLHRPVLSVPVAMQFEQVLNARYLMKEGYGMAAEAVTQEALGAFLDRIPEFGRNLEGYRQDGNRVLFSKLDELFEAL
ncbi:MAG: MJ1255/VC2487 family glycosyltransferase [Deltaproteobacteria bacterium]